MQNHIEKLSDWASKEDILRHNISCVEHDLWTVHAQLSVLHQLYELGDPGMDHNEIYRCLTVAKTSISSKIDELSDAADDYLTQRKAEIEEERKKEPPMGEILEEKFAPGRLFVGYTILALRGKNIAMHYPDEEYHSFVNSVYEEVQKIREMNKEELAKYRAMHRLVDNPMA